MLRSTTALALVLALAACASAPAPHKTIDPGPPALAPEEAHVAPPPPAPAYPLGSAEETLADVRRTVSQANAAGTVIPRIQCFIGVECRPPYVTGASYVIPMIEHDLTLVCTGPGEVIGKVIIPGGQVTIANDRSEWGTGDSAVQCADLMPNRAGMSINVFIMTNLHLYTLQVHTYPAGYVRKRAGKREVVNPYGLSFGRNPGMAPVERFDKPNVAVISWTYPADPSLPAVRPMRDRSRDRKTGIELSKAHCNYTLSGDTPDWFPVPMPDTGKPVCDDGSRTYLNFDPTTLSGFSSPTLVILKDKERVPLQHEKINATFVAQGVHDDMLLYLGGQEVKIHRDKDEDRK